MHPSSTESYGNPNLCPPPQRTADIYDIHRQAVAEYHEACKGFSKAEAMRAQAKAQLDKATEELAKSVQATIQDPTVPQQPMNGQIAGVGSLATQQLRQF
jgi:hypothetical protein